MTTTATTGWAERRLGEMLEEGPKNPGAKGRPGPGRGKRGVRVEPRFDAPPTIADLGPAASQRHAAQQLTAGGYNGPV